MIREVKERQVSVPKSAAHLFENFHALLRDGVVAEIDSITSQYYSHPEKERIEAYIRFLQEVLEAMEQTRPLESKGGQ